LIEPDALHGIPPLNISPFVGTGRLISTEY
jgi:hypothetical protein